MKKPLVTGLVLIAISATATGLRNGRSASIAPSVSSAAKATVEGASISTAPHLPAATSAAALIPRLERRALNAPTITDEKRELHTRDANELKRVISQTQGQLKAGNFVALANSKGLSNAQAEEVATLVNRLAAAKLILIERKLAAIEEKRR